MVAVFKKYFRKDLQDNFGCSLAEDKFGDLMILAKHGVKITKKQTPLTCLA